MAVTPLMVKEIREKTGAGMLDCKKALEACDCDMEKAIVWLREKGIAKAAKKESRVAAEGLCSAAAKGNDAIVFELNSETDFVAKNQKFVDLLAKLDETLLASDAKCTDCALEVACDGKTVKEVIVDNAAVIGEKISLRRVARINKTDSQTFGVYKHQGGRIVVVVTVEGNDATCAKDIAMHVAANAPKYVSVNDIPAAEREAERTILLNTALNENATAAKPKPENIIEKMVEGRLNKSMQEVCLLSQPFVKNPDQTVEAYAKSCGCTVVSFTRLAVGEGIEKEVVDFAAEVAAQAAAANK